MIDMLFGFTVMTAFVPGVIGATVNTAWAVMWLVAPFLLLKCKINVTIIHILGLLFLSYAALTLLWAPHGLLELMQMLALASVFVWGYSLKDLRSVTIGLSIGLAISSTIAIMQYLKIDLPIVTALGGKPAGLFINSNIYAEVSGMILVLILINKLYWYIPVTFVGLTVTSRAVSIALGFSLAMFVWSKSKLLSVFIIISSWLIALKLSDAVVYGGGKIADTLADGVSANVSSLNVRLHMWYDMLVGFKIFGNGIGSFVYLFPEYNKHLDTSVTLAEYAHNDLLQLIFELGIGAIPLVLIATILLKVNDEYRNALTYFIIIGCFGFPLHIPATGFMVALVAAQLAKHVTSSRFAFNSRRSTLLNRMETA